MLDILKLELREESPPVLRVEGEIDMATVDELRSALTEALAADPDLVVDMTEVTFIDAQGLGVVLDAAASLDGNAPLTVRNGSRVAWLLDIVGQRECAPIRFVEVD